MITTDDVRSGSRSQSITPTENWFAKCVASVDAALSRNGIRFVQTQESMNSSRDLNSIALVLHPLAIALAEHQNTICGIAGSSISGRM